MIYESIYKQFLSHCDNGFAAIDNGIISEINNALCELTGRTSEDLIGAGIDILFDIFSVETIVSIYDSYNCGEVCHTISGELLQKKGDPRPVEILVNCTDDKHWLLIKNKSFRIEMENKLRQSQLMLSTSLESLPFDFWINDNKNRTWMQNSYSKALWGDVKGKPPTAVGADPEITEKWLESTRKALNGEVVSSEIEYNIDGSKKAFRNIIAPIKDGDHLLGILGMNIDITDLKEALAMRDMLIKEIHHRVKNNLQMISSIVNLEAENFCSDEDRVISSEIINRIDAISLVHEKLYKTEYKDNVNLAEYIRDLVDHIVSGVTVADIFVDYKLIEEFIDSDRVIILGIVITELVTNAIKYAFGGEGRHLLKIELNRVEDNFFISVADNGPGLDDLKMSEKEGSLGFRLIEALSAQIHGKFARESSSHGCIFTLNFTNKKTETA